MSVEKKKQIRDENLDERVIFRNCKTLVFTGFLALKKLVLQSLVIYKSTKEKKERKVLIGTR